MCEHVQQSGCYHSILLSLYDIIMFNLDKSSAYVDNKKYTQNIMSVFKSRKYKYTYT